jgi:hypothetical protein
MGATRVVPWNWLHDDTEEDLVGASWHQRAIRATSSSLEREHRDLEAQRAETERQRADDLAQRIAALEAELARLRQQE